MLNFILGRNNSGKTEYIRNIISEKVGSGEASCILIVPEQFSFESERRILEAVGAEKMLNVEILSFSRLSYVINEKYGKVLNKTIDDGGRAVIMSLTLEALEDELQFYKKYISKPMLLHQLLTFSTELKQCALCPEDIMSVSSKVSSGSLSKKLHELGLITSLYDVELKKNFTDDSDLLTLAAQLIPETDYFCGKTVLVDAFSGFTKQERNILEEIMCKADNVFVSLCTDSQHKTESDFSVFENVINELEELKNCANKRGVKIAVPKVLQVETEGRKKDLVYLEKQLCKINKEKFDGKCENIILCAAANMSDEADFVACEIKKLLRKNDSLRCREIAVIERTSGTYDNELSESFKKYGIPFYEDKRQPVSNQSVIIMVETLLALCSGSISTELILRYLKTGLTEITDSCISELENYVFIWNIDGTKWKNDFTENPDGLGIEFNEQSEKLLAQLNETRKSVVAPLLSFKKNFSDADGTEKSEMIYNFLIRNKTDIKIKELIDAFIESGNPELAEEQDTVWCCLMDILDKMAASVGKRVISSKRYYELFSILLSAVSLGTLPQGLDSVTVGSADRMRISDCKIVFIIGADSGVFPLDPPTDGLLSDRERKDIEQFDLHLAKTAEVKAVDELFMAYHAITSAYDKVYISYSLSSYDGKSMLPSDIVNDIATIFNDVKRLDTALILPENKIESNSSAFQVLSQIYKQNNEFSSSLKKYFSDNTEYSGRLLSLDRMINGKDISIKDKDIATKLFGKNMFVSASRVETFYKCPFEYFCKYGLNAKPRKQAKLDPAQSGTVIHYVLEQVLSSYKKEDLVLYNSEKLRGIVNGVLSDYLDSVMGGEKEKPKRFLYLYNRLSETLTEVLTRIAEEMKVSDFTPVDFELKIDRDASVNAYEVPLPDGGKLFIRGSVDRVDTMKKNGKTYLRVIDYKSGGKDFRLSDIFDGLNMQMLIYLFAITENGKERYGDIVPSGVLYMPAKKAQDSLPRNAKDSEIKNDKIKKTRFNGIITYDKDVIEGMDRSVSGNFIDVKADEKNGGYKGRLVTLEELGKLKRKVDGILKDMAVSLQSGNIEVLPSVGSGYTTTCDYCDYSTVCGFETGSPTRKIDDLSFKEACAKLNSEEAEINDRK